MNHLKKDNDPFSYLYRQFSSLEFKQQETIKNLIENYYPLNKEEEIFIKDISIENKNEFISQIKKIFHELSISMETIEYIFSQYYQFIINNSNNNNNQSNNNPFGPLQKSEVINKFGLSSNIYKKIMDLFFKIIINLKDNKDNNNIANNIISIDNDVIMKDIDENKNENEKENKKILEQKIKNINLLSEEMGKLFDDYKNQKSINNKDSNKMEEEKKEQNNRRKFNLTPDEEKSLKEKLTIYEKNVL